MIPPHEIVARSYVTFSVFEGAGRTPKGRDLCRVRNAVFQKTGRLKSDIFVRLLVNSDEGYAKSKLIFKNIIALCKLFCS
ncbi:hypothetical protein L1987_76123 [Smallanthus sonchifolius]|uniref:Uncharacterized protein n=1 Tax=Smallanthus sonchifolius TaxID=185202 RepID=A0ACB9A7C1_9ASTR|nr:hypothetical protein L1987_76123 [Smallanthus sonchifolius]